MTADDSRGLSRRDLAKAALAIGGTSALAACQEAERAPSEGETDQPEYPRGVEDPAELPDRQHAWDDYLVHGVHGTVTQSQHQLLLGLSYEGSVPPTDAERETVEAALAGVERAYERSAAGLLLTVSYSPYYFQRFDEDLPESVDLPEPRALADFEDPDPDDVDAIVHLASDHGEVVMGAEEALKGEVDELNGVSQPEASLTDVFTLGETGVESVRTYTK